MVDTRFNFFKIIISVLGWGIGWLIGKEAGLSIYEIFKMTYPILAVNLYFATSQAVLGLIGMSVFFWEYNETL